jgi:hypothetical protein
VAVVDSDISQIAGMGERPMEPARDATIVTSNKYNDILDLNEAFSTFFVRALHVAS